MVVHAGWDGQKGIYGQAMDETPSTQWPTHNHVLVFLSSPIHPSTTYLPRLVILSPLHLLYYPAQGLPGPTFTTGI